MWYVGLRIAEFALGRSQPKKLEAKAVKTLASTCWAEVVIDIEGPNPADQHGYRYILTYLDALSHGFCWNL